MYYTQALHRQLKPEVTSLLNRLLRTAKSLTLEEKLKDPNSLESKMLATLVASVVATQWWEATIVKLNAELYALEELLKKEALKRQQNPSSSFDFGRDEFGKERTLDKPVRLTELHDRLAIVTAKIQALKADKVKLEHQHKVAKTQLREIHEQELSSQLGEFNLVINHEALELFHQLNDQQAKPFSVDRVIASYEQAQGANVPPPPVHRERFAERMPQVRTVSYESALIGILLNIYNHNPDPHRTLSNLQSALEILPIMSALSIRQVEGLKELDQFFEQKHRHIDGMIREVEGQRDALSAEIYHFAASLLNPSLSPSFGKSQEESEEEEALLRYGHMRTRTSA